MGQETKKNLGQWIYRGGARYEIEKASDLFAVKKRATAKPGLLETLKRRDRAFEPTVQSLLSRRSLEVYRVGEKHLDETMTALRVENVETQWCAHVYHMRDNAECILIPEDCLYVEMAPEADPEAIYAMMDEYGLELASDDAETPGAVTLRLTSAASLNPIKISNLLNEHPAIRVAEPDFSVPLEFLAFRPTDELFKLQWHLENKGGFSLKRGADVSAPDAWDITRGERSISICITDDGVDLAHPDFSSPNKIVNPRDFGEDDFDPSPVFNNQSGRSDNHGTACAGVAVADENGKGVVGVAPGCALMPVRTSGMINNQAMTDLFGYCRQNGADVISCSWKAGSPFFALSTPMIKAIERAAREGRAGKGCVVVFAAGNSDRPINGKKNNTLYRNGFAVHPDVIAVSASNSRDLRSHYSDYGSEIWVCAPSSGAGGKGIVTTDRTGFEGYQSGDYTTQERFGGTSSATPLVAGVCGLILSVNPVLTSAEVKDILKTTADKIDPDAGEYASNGHSPFYGWGRVNAFRAVQEAMNRKKHGAEWSTAPGAPIPDRDPQGIVSELAVDGSGILREIELTIDISHSFRGDLRVVLTAPNGLTAKIHEFTGGGADHIRQSYKTEDTPSLRALVEAGTEIQGVWRLHVADHAAADIGALNEWRLKLTT